MLENLLEAVRLAVGMCFLVSACAKARSFGTFLEGISSFHILPDIHVLIVCAGSIIVGVELVLGLSFIGMILLKHMCFLGLLLLMVFGGATLLAKLRGIETTCFCFGRGGAEAMSIKGMVRWVLLTSGVVVVFVEVDESVFWESAVDVFPDWGCMAVAGAILVTVLWLIEGIEACAWMWRVVRSTAGSSSTGHRASPSRGAPAQIKTAPNS